MYFKLNEEEQNRILKKLKIDFPKYKIKIDSLNYYINNKKYNNRKSIDLYVHIEEWWKFWKPKFNETIFFTDMCIKEYGEEQYTYLDLYKKIKETIEQL
jgi:hypothetical protein